MDLSCGEDDPRIGGAAARRAPTAAAARCLDRLPASPGVSRREGSVSRRETLPDTCRPRRSGRSPGVRAVPAVRRGGGAQGTIAALPGRVDDTFGLDLGGDTIT